MSDQGRAILEEIGLIIHTDCHFDKRMKTDPDSGHPIPTYRFNPPRKYMGMILYFVIATPNDLDRGHIWKRMACSPEFRNEHSLLVWVAKNESKIRLEIGNHHEQAE